MEYDKGNCLFFPNEMHLAYRSMFSEGHRIKHSSAWECYYCSNYYVKKSKFDKRWENCSGQLEIIYDFNIQNLVTYEDNIKCKGNTPLLAYIDFETTTPADSCLNPEDKKMFPVSYVVIFAFHPELKVDRIIIERSYEPSRDKLLNIDCSTRAQMKFINPKVLLQLRDAAIAVANRGDKLAISTMFNIELSLLLMLC